VKPFWTMDVPSELKEFLLSHSKTTCCRRSCENFSPRAVTSESKARIPVMSSQCSQRGSTVEQ
jgi:hypothetical protein